MTEDGPKRYIELRPIDKELPDVGDIVRLQHKDGPDSVLGKVVSFDGWNIQLNNSDKYYSIVNWYVRVLHTEIDTD